MPTYALLSRLLSEDGAAELLRLQYLNSDEAIDRYAVTFTGTTEQEWRALYDLDPRDVPYVFERTDGERVAFASICVIWDAKSREIRVRYQNMYSTSPPRSFFDWLLGRKGLQVPQARWRIV